MNNLTVGEILKRIKQFKKEKGLTEKQLSEIPVFIGCDDELNEIHTAWYIQPVEKANPKDLYLLEMIEEMSGNIKPADTSFLIS